MKKSLIKEIFFVIVYLKFSQQINIFFFKGFLFMMFFLVENIIIHISYMRMSIGKSTVSLLPCKFALNKFVVINKIGWLFLMSLAKSLLPFPDVNPQCMDVIGHAVHNNWFLIFSLDYTNNVFMHIIFPTVIYQILPSFNSKNDLDVDLRKCSRHDKKI